MHIDQSQDESKRPPLFTGAARVTDPQPPHSRNAASELAAYRICRQPLDLAGRKPIQGYAIDGADPETPMDRDDAIGVEFTHDRVRGNLATLHITIADVAAACPPVMAAAAPLAALDTMAARHGETQYFSHGMDPMLPHRLQDRLSLEQGKERAGLTISVTMDDHCNIVHTEFSRTRILTQCRSYRDATKDIQIHGHPIQQIAMVANRLLRRKSGVTDLPRYDEATGMYTDSEGIERHVSPDELNAYKTVQGSMIAANEAAAKVMGKSNFLFRNHSYLFFGRGSEDDFICFRREQLTDIEELPRKWMQNRAEYSAKCKGHYGLDSPSYSHVTSPIRRYADLVNQRMMHWAIDIVEAVANQLLIDARLPLSAREAIKRKVWEHAPMLLGRATEYLQANRHMKKARASRLKAQLMTIMKAHPETPVEHSRASALRMVEAIAEIPLPYTRKQMAQVARALNATLEANRARRRELKIDRIGVQLNMVFPKTDPKQLAAWGAHGFSMLLEAAARRGDNNDIFAAEVEKRLAEDRATLVENLYSILIVAGERKDAPWLALKKQALMKLKADAALTEKVFAHLQHQQQGSPDTQTRIVEATLLDSMRHMYPGAQVVHSHQHVDYSAPLIAADTPEHARQVALLVFFRSYGSLHRRDQIDTPELIELAIARAKVKKGDRLELLRRTCGGSFAIEERVTSARDIGPVPDARRVEVMLQVRHRITGETITKARVGYEEQARDKAAKYILDDARFHDMLTQSHVPMEAGRKLSATTHAEILPEVVWAKNIHVVDLHIRADA